MKKPLLTILTLPVINTIRRLVKFGMLAVACAAVFIGIAFCLFTFVFLPSLDHYRPYLAHYLSQKIKRPVMIGSLSGYWDGVSARLVLKHLNIMDPAGGQALTLDQVDIKPSWVSLLVWEPRLSLIQVDGPTIEVRRWRDQRITLNGFTLTSVSSDNAFTNWLLRQSRVVITHATCSWQDDYLGLPRLTVQQGNVDLAQGLFKHHLNVIGQSAFSPKTQLNLSASWYGDDINQWKKWHGTLDLMLYGAKVGAWSHYLDRFGILRSGEGNGTLTLAFSQARIDSLVADVRIHNAIWRPLDARELTVPTLHGHVVLTRKDNTYRIYASDLTLASQTGLAFNHSRIDGSWTDSEQGGGELVLDNADLSHLTPFIHAIGIDRNPMFAHFSPSGTLKNLTVSWHGRRDAPKDYRLTSQFSRLTWMAFDTVPGVSEVSGMLSFDQQGGELTLSNNQHTQIRIPSVFPHALQFDRLEAAVNWSIDKRNGVTVNIKQLQFANKDLSGWLLGHYRSANSLTGVIDITAGLNHTVSAQRVPDYLPYQAGEKTITWLKHALKGGFAHNVTMRLKGDLDRFPFKGGQGGDFLVSAQVQQGALFYDKAWPVLTDIQAGLIFHNEQMQITGRSAKTVGVPLKDIKVSIADLTASNTALDIQGKASAPLATLLAFSTRSPIQQMTSGFLGSIRAKGEGTVALNLRIPLVGNENPHVNGKLFFLGNTLALTSLPIPELSDVQGSLNFTERGVYSPNIQMKAWGGTFTLTADTPRTGGTHVAVEGTAETAQVVSSYSPALSSYVRGHSRYHADFVIRNGLENLNVSSDLVGTNIRTVPPVGKTPEEAKKFTLTLTPLLKEAQMEAEVTLGTETRSRWRISDEGKWLGGQVAVNTPLPAYSNDNGFHLSVVMPSIELEAYRRLVAGSTAPDLTMPLTIQLKSPIVTWQNCHLNDVVATVRHVPAGQAWNLALQARQASGTLNYFAAEGQLVARFSRLAFDSSLLCAKNEPTPQVGDTTRPTPMPHPFMDISVDELLIRGQPVGTLTVKAAPRDKDWIFDSIVLNTKEGHVTGEMRIHPTSDETDDETDAHVKSRFIVESQNIGQLLDRFGIHNTFYKGRGRVSGELSWPGGIIDVDLAHTIGHVEIDLHNGRFAKMDPGVARLLGIISLQSLARLIRLDFVDVFSEGFAFDTLQGNAGIKQGIFNTQGIQMKGPAANVTIQGTVNLVNEQQSLRVHVEPHLSEGVALATGAALINPIAGVAALAAQKVLQDPVSKMFSVDYQVTGSLQAPSIHRVNTNPRIGNTR